jgi:hypothetical protein
MDAEGPQLEALTHRLSECSADFLGKPTTAAARGTVDVPAVVCDLLRAMGATPNGADAVKRFAPPALTPAVENWLRLVCVASWLLHDEWFLSRGAQLAPAVWDLLVNRLDGVAKVSRAEKAVTDPDRREELARLCLSALKLRPRGETREQAADRLTTLDSVERERVVKQTRAAEERARQIREAMAAKAAEEAANMYGRE